MTYSILYIIKLLVEVEAAVEEVVEVVVYRVAGQLVEVTEVGVDTEEADEGVDTGAEAEEEEVATDSEYDLLYPFERNDFYLDANFFVQKRVKKAALNFICDQNHVLNSCYETNRNFNRMPRKHTNRFLESFIPFSIQLLNN